MARFRLSSEGSDTEDEADEVTGEAERVVGAVERVVAVPIEEVSDAALLRIISVVTLLMLLPWYKLFISGIR